MSFTMTQLDSAQVIRSEHDDVNQAQRVKQIAGALITEPYDEIALTYITSGNGTGEIGTATYKNASVTVGTLTLSYDSSNRLINVLRS